LAAFRRRLSLARVGVENEAAMAPEWQTAIAVSAGLPEDTQGLFLLLARAAIAGAAAPSDFEVARACGSHSPKRARRLLGFLEERGAIVCRDTADGRRIVALPDLDRETAPGDPSAAPVALAEPALAAS
jgi:hypothetical protein